MGPCAGGDVYSPAMTDFIFMVRDTSYMFVTGPDVVKTVTNEVVTAEELGAVRAHHQIGRCRRRFENNVECLLQMRRLIDFLPSNNEAGVPEWPTMDDLERQENRSTADPRKSQQTLRHQGTDPQSRRRGDFFEFSAAYAKNIVTGFGRVAGRTVGFVANQPMVLAGVLDSDASRKPRASCASATPSIFPSLPSSTCPASCPARTGIWGLIKHGESCCSPIRKARRRGVHRDHAESLRRRL